MDREVFQILYSELASLDRRGISLWYEGERSTPLNVTKEICAHEDRTYMRDYIYDEGVLTELHFDAVTII